MIKENLAENISVNISENSINATVKNCTYLDVAKKALQHNEKTCPICLISLAASIPTSIIKGLSFYSLDYSTDLEKKECKLHISFERKS